jgi:hypothetical protein
MKRTGVGVGVDGDGPYSQPRAGSHDAQRDFAAIGDQDRANGTG